MGTNTQRRNAPGVEGSAIAMDPTQPVYDPTSPFDGFFEFRDGKRGENTLTMTAEVFTPKESLFLIKR